MHFHLVCPAYKLQNAGKEFKKHSTPLPDVWIPELRQYNDIFRLFGE
jgi:hypothetical protein